MRLPLIIGAAATLTACGALPAQAQSLTPFEGMWQVSPRGPGPGGRGGPGVGGERRGPPPGGMRAQQQGGAGGQPGRFGPGPGRLGPPDGAPEAGEFVDGPDIEGLDRGDLRTWSLMTPAGRAAFEAMDPHDLPANNCLSNGLPSLVGIPDLQEWHVDGDVLTIHYADFGTVRTIYLDGRAAGGMPIHLGYSTGTWEGDTFVVTTTGLTASPGGLGRNAPGSASRSYVERYRIGVDGTVSGSVTITDPEYLTQQLTVPIAFSRPEAGATIPDDVGCSVEASQRYLDG